MRRSIGVAWEQVARAAEPRHVSLPLVLASLLLGGVAWALHHYGIAWSLASGDAYEYGEMARRLAAGEGFTPASSIPRSSGSAPLAITPP